MSKIYKWNKINKIQPKYAMHKAGILVTRHLFFHQGPAGWELEGRVALGTSI